MTTWIFLIALCAFFALYVAAPLFLQNARVTSPQISAAEVRRESLQTQKRELKLDRETGKIDADEYRRLHLELELEDSVAATRASTRAVSAVPNADDLALEAEILIARARNKQSSVSVPQRETAKSSDSDLDAALENAIANARREKKAEPEAARVLASSTINSTQTKLAKDSTPNSWTCAACSREMSNPDKFCASCGAPRSDATNV